MDGKKTFGINSLTKAVLELTAEIEQLKKELHDSLATNEQKLLPIEHEISLIQKRLTVIEE